ncbi:hypothetical protein CCYA_CCYA10G2854 [Cyanidiococcus yangmingshanensis]|nr:hypothetical protein CCYA_CCYA10G2854 [Cyanidiococcus yangmingshanensis]
MYQEMHGRGPVLTAPRTVSSSLRLAPGTHCVETLLLNAAGKPDGGNPRQKLLNTGSLLGFLRRSHRANQSRQSNCSPCPLERTQALAFNRLRMPMNVARQFTAEVPKESVPQQRPAGAKEDLASSIWLRPPIVTVMGHVNHGKTTLLDALRETQLAEQEAGGITQNIRAFRVFWERILGPKMDMPTIPWITFLDTPGHEAFTEMRARGASVTDLVVLVVAADDGVMPQTLEAVDHARAASVPIIVALNKCDKVQGQRRSIYRALEQRAGLRVEALGGDVQCVEISALKRLHLDQLVEAILLQASLLETERTTSVHGPAGGVCLEARMDRGHGLVLDCILQQGKLRPGDILVTPRAWGRARLLLDEHGQRLHEAWPAQPVTIIGMRRLDADTEVLVEPGSIIRSVENEHTAKAIVSTERPSMRLEVAASVAVPSSLATEPPAKQETHAAGLDLIIRGTCRGTVEAIAQAVQQLSSASFPIRILHCATGTVCKADVLLASSSLERPAQIIAFQTKVPKTVAEMASARHIPLKSFAVIYEILDHIRQAQERAISLANKTPTITGRARVQQLFTYSASKRGAEALRIGGCRVVEGVIRRRQRVRVLRQGTCVYEGTLNSLKHFRDDVPDVRKGQECGIAIHGFAFQVDDEVISLDESD